jgi:hypothetical protein
LGSRWTIGQVLEQAPDASSATAARGLANPRTWSDLGSARSPYQVTVDLTEPAFRCTCPSRKLPCPLSAAIDDRLVAL